MVTAQFVAVGGTGTDLQSIKGKGDDLYDFSIQTLDSAGRTDKAFVWNDWDFEDGAWADDDGNREYTIAAGQGLWIQAKNGYSIMSCGEVNLKDVVINMVDGFVAVGNPFPVAINLQDLVGTGDDLYDFSIQTLDSAGRTDKAFVWNDWDFENGAWADDDGNSEFTIAPGAGLWVQGKAGYTLRIPAPEVK